MVCGRKSEVTGWDSTMRKANCSHISADFLCGKNFEPATTELLSMVPPHAATELLKALPTLS